MDEPKCPSVDEWTSELWNTHTMEYSSAVKRNKGLTHATMWVILKYFMLSEKSPIKKGHILRDPIYMK